MDEICQGVSVEHAILEAQFFGRDQPYQPTHELMHALHAQVCRQEIADQLMLLEHEPVITVTRQHFLKSLKTSEARIKECGIAVAVADRGGDVTFHGPGQLVGYPIIHLNRKQKASMDTMVDLEGYLRLLESGLLCAVHQFGLKKAQLLPGFTGIWIRTDNQKRIEFKKLVAIGIGVTDFVTKHGFALNIDIDHGRYTEHIVPCGLKDRGVITLKEAFCMESLEIPNYSAIVTTVAQCLSKTLSLQLQWRSVCVH